MTSAIQQYNTGHFEHQMPHIRGREYNELVSSIRHLATASSETNEQQRNFIANVSHDFRSPLTSIKGYTEAIMDGTIPPEIQEKYLGIILSETKRLEKLTESLLELNRYENQGILLTYSTFDVNEIIKNVASVFEQRCTEKRISIQLIFSTKVLLVEADRAKISQVVQNLLDNAIKFSYADSTIEVHTFDRAGKAFVTVRDHGIGIPKESLSHIWDRFYKTDLSRGKDKTGTGLGLAIIKEIIDAHHEHLHATSIVGVGTDFSFTLRCHHVAGYF
jgi:signal transduction histidine kinase